MKEIDLSKVSFSERTEYFREVRMLASIRHSNIVVYRESFLEDSLLCIIMDFADGGDMEEMLGSQKGLGFPDSVIKEWFSDMAVGMSFIHDKSIVHRDIKPQNMLFSVINYQYNRMVTLKLVILEYHDFDIRKEKIVIHIMAQ